MFRDEFLVRESYAARPVFEEWLTEIDRLEASTISLDAEDTVSFENSLSLGRSLFPLMETISWNLFGEGTRRYLNDLGYPASAAELIVQIFRNGNAHNNRAHQLFYDGGVVAWEVVSSAGSGGFRPYLASEDGAFEYEPVDGGAKATLYVARLVAQVRADLQARLETVGEDSLELIVGRRMKGPVPSF